MSSRRNESPVDTRVTAPFLFGLRLGVLAVSTIILLSLSILRNPSVYQPFWAQMAVFGTLVVIVCVEAGLAYRRMSWGSARWSALAIALTATVVSCASLPPGSAATSVDWAYGTIGWIGVILLLDRPIRELAIFLSLMTSIDITNLLLPGEIHSDSFLNFAAASIGTIGYPLAVGVGAMTLRSVAKKAHEAGEQAEKTRTQEALAATLHEHRQNRFAALSRTAFPLLQGLASGTLDPNNASVQRDCAIEAARMRRLFAEADGVPNKLIHELRHCAEIAERKGVIVELQTQGTCPDPPVEIRRALTEAPIVALSTAVSWARVTFTAADDRLAVNVVSDSGPIAFPSADQSPVQLSVFVDGQTLWVETQWTIIP